MEEQSLDCPVLPNLLQSSSTAEGIRATAAVPIVEEFFNVLGSLAGVDVLVEEANSMRVEPSMPSLTVFLSKTNKNLTLLTSN